MKLDNVTNVWATENDTDLQVLEASVAGMQNRWNTGYPTVKFRNGAGEEYAHTFRHDTVRNVVEVQLEARDVKRAGMCILTVEWHDRGRVVKSRQYMGMIEKAKMDKPKYEVIGGEEAGGGGLPEGGEPWKQLVTDGDGKTVWEDRLAYKEAEKVLVHEQKITLTGNAVGMADITPDVYETFEEGKVYNITWRGAVHEIEATPQDGYEEGAYESNWLRVADDQNGDLYVLGNGTQYHIEFNGGSGTLPFALTAPGSIKPIDSEYIGGWDNVGSKTGKVELTFDGDTTGYEVVEMSSSFILVKISDDIPAKENMIGAVLTTPEGSITVTEDLIVVQSPAVYAVTEFVMVVRDYTLMGSAGIPSNGIWIAMNGEMYITKIEYTGTVYTPIPKAYLPEDIGGGVMRVVVTAETDDEGNETYSASHTYAEIVEAIQAGKHVECICGNDVLQLNWCSDISGMATYVASLGVGFSTVNWSNQALHVKIYESGTVRYSYANLIS